MAKGVIVRKMCKDGMLQAIAEGWSSGLRYGKVFIDILMNVDGV